MEAIQNKVFRIFEIQCALSDLNTKGALAFTSINPFQLFGRSTLRGLVFVIPRGWFSYMFVRLFNYLDN